MAREKITLSFRQRELLNFKKEIINSIEKKTVEKFIKNTNNNKGKILKQVQETMIKNIESEVYNSYNPKQYERRKQDDGLASLKNITVDIYAKKKSSKISGSKKELGYYSVIEINNIAQPSPSVLKTDFIENSPFPLLTDWVEFGLVPPLSSGGHHLKNLDPFINYGEYTHPRAFMKKTQYDLIKDDALLNTVLKGL